MMDTSLTFYVDFIIDQSDRPDKFRRDPKWSQNKIVLEIDSEKKLIFSTLSTNLDTLPDCPVSLCNTGCYLLCLAAVQSDNFRRIFDAGVQTSSHILTPI